MSKKSKSSSASAKFSRKIKENRKAKRSIGTTRLIERKLEMLRRAKLKDAPESLQTHMYFDAKDIAPSEQDEELEESIDFGHEALFVLEPSDFDELSSEEVKVIWQNRNTMCGSDRAAAEALALYEVITGISSIYKGWQSYVNNPEVILFREQLEAQLEVKETSSFNDKFKNVLYKNVEMSEVESSNGYLLNQIGNLSLEELKQAWSNRETSFLSIEAASEALSRIRFESGIDLDKKPWQHLISLPSIHELSLELPSELSIQEEVTQISQVDVSKELKTYGLVKQKLRFGQANFRDMVIKTYNGICCITDCSEKASLEAAHIRPYSGKKSNIIENSLLLRADIHKLFDKFMISIQPDNLNLVISKKIKDHYYLSLHGKKLFNGINVPSVVFLREHYETFRKIEKSKN